MHIEFVSYRHQGGGFINGSIAQEEVLCHESTLYNVLSSDRIIDYYAWNNQNDNDSLYLNRAIYYPDIIFNRNDIVIKTDVLTCAALNISCAHLDEKYNYKILEERMVFISNIININNVNIFIAGAFGCGVF